MIFKGSGVALVTPFDENNKVNFKKLSELIEFQIEKKTDAIIVCGTTGESSTLSNEEKYDIIKFSSNCINGRVPLIAGTGSNNTALACELSKEAENLGADGLLLVTPYYNKCSQDGLFLHYKKIANSVNLPIILYNVPSRTGVNIEPDTVLKLSDISNVCGLKEASGNISQVAEIISKVSEDFYVYSGNDDQIVPILSLGGKGVISVLANILPNETHNICDYFFNNKHEESKRLQLKYFNLIKSLFIDVNPIPVKEAMNILGFNVGGLRLPLSNIPEKKLFILLEGLKNAGQI